MDFSTKIQILEQKIKDYKAKYPKRNWEQIEELNCLWLELAYWQLVQKGEIKLPNYLEKVEKSWTHLKEIYQQKGKWPRKRLKEFLGRQKKEYREWLVWLVELEQEEKYLKFGKWLKEWVKGNLTK